LNWDGKKPNDLWVYEDKTSRFFHCLGDIYVESPLMHGKTGKEHKALQVRHHWDQKKSDSL
jgi:hypothetical protein